MEPFATLEAWEQLKSFVLEGDPSVMRSIEDRREADWSILSTSEAQVLAIVVALGFSRENPSDRRRSRRLLGSLAAAAEGEQSVMEEEPTPSLDDEVIAALQKTLRWIAENPPSRLLASEAGPQAAIRCIQKNAPSLQGLAAYRWLVALGYPCSIPDPPRRRWLERMGLAEPDPSASPSVMHRRTLGVLEDLARAAQTTLSEVDTVLEAFTGAGLRPVDAVALCGRNPRCGECPLRDTCRCGVKQREKREPESRNLSVIMREESRPRERLAELGPSALTEEELLAILIRTGGGGLNAMDVAMRMLRDAGSLERLAAMSIAELMAYKGMGRVKAVTIKAALELARRRKDPSPGELARRPVKNSRQIYECVEGRFIGAAKEEFVVLLLDIRLYLIRVVTVSLGTLNQSIVHPREAFAQAIRDSAHTVVFVHNHPTGDPAPSRQDEVITRQLVQAGNVVGIRVLDHVIVGQGRYYSFSDDGKMP